MSIYEKLLIAAAAGAVAITGLSGDTHFVEPAQEIIYTVQHGDTLWSIAGQYVEEGENILEVISDIKRNNDISSEIYPGEKIIIYR